MVRSKSSSVRSSTPRVMAMPALLTRMSIGPSPPVTRSTIPATGLALRDVGGDHDRAAALLADLTCELLGLADLLAAVDRHRGACFS